MPAVTVRIPGLLARFTDGRHDVSVDADTVASAVDGLLEEHPPLEPHLFDEAGQLREHLRLFHEGSSIEWQRSSAVRLAAGDEVIVLQAVSGG